jgi:hypothetical protein
VKRQGIGSGEEHWEVPNRRLMKTVVALL